MVRGQQNFSRIVWPAEADEHACRGGSSGGACCGDGNSECKSSGESGVCLTNRIVVMIRVAVQLDKNDTPTSESAAFDNEEAATSGSRRVETKLAIHVGHIAVPVFVALLILRALAFFAPP